MPGPENGWWMEGRGWIGHWLVHPLCPRNQFILSPCPAPALNEGGKPETGSAQRHPPAVRSPVLSLFYPLNDVRGEEWATGKRLYVRVALLIRLGEVGGDIFFFEGGGCVCYYFPFIEEKIEACKCLMWGLMCTEKEREVHLYSSSTDGPCRSDVLSPSAGRPVWSCLCMCPRYSWHQPTVAWHSPNVELPRLKQRAIFYTLVPLLFLCCRHTDH